MQWEIDAYSTPLFIAALITSLLALYAWRRREVPGAVPFAFLMLSVAIWSLGYGFEIAAPTFSSKHLAAKVQYFGIVGVPLFWLIYTIQFTGNSTWLSRMKDIDLTIRMLEELNRLGVQISIDDFGTGNSSLSHLKNFPASSLKIDRSFIGDVIQNQSDASIISAIIAMAHTLEITVIAEGVETEEQLDFLLSQKCDQAQGFLFCQPLNREDLSTFLLKGEVKYNENVR